MAEMKRIKFLGDSLEQLREFPEAARKAAGVQLHKLQLHAFQKKTQQTAKRDLDLAAARLRQI